ncbi:hypothetical protein B0T19DRAFT_432258 [Cercophora scortea]|uniref:Defect at low temperature protein 1 n=1 Tax=Cercophora scortea TaxID=314031 RepID=A0AAE0M6N0_9PEZI|nr:hypothetical protein B0T19DRAFT_432258 [Cercophora scortea]
MSAASLAFRVVYNFSYYVLYLVLLALLIISPADLMRQAVLRRQNYNILIIAACYFISIVLIAFIYATRLFVNRSALASIPKTWVPVEKGDAPSDVQHMIAEGVGRSAAVAYEARPRVPLVPPQQPPPPPQQQQQRNGTAHKTNNSTGPQTNSEKRTRWPSRLRKTSTSDDGIAIDIVPPHRAVWGEIEHPGWASPTCVDLPNLQYDTVISELPNLIEAKALTLAPPDPNSHADPPLLEPEAVALLQRPETMGLREYLAHLTELGVLAPSPTTGDFIAKYELARYSTQPLSNAQFRRLMHLFAEILRGMHTPDPAVLERYGYGYGYDDDGQSGHMPPPSESDIDNDAPRGTSPSSAASSINTGTYADDHDNDGQSQRSVHTQQSATGSMVVVNRLPSSSSSSRSSGSGRRSRLVRPAMMARNSSANTWQYRTAPTTPKSRHTVLSSSGASRAESEESFAQTRRVYEGPLSSSSSATASLVEGSRGGR